MQPTANTTPNTTPNTAENAPAIAQAGTAVDHSAIAATAGDRLQPARPHASPVTVIGGGAAGAWQALMFARAGCAVTLIERDPSLSSAAAHWAGGMLAPWCEREAAEPAVTRLGLRSLALWRAEALEHCAFNGSLVIAHQRDHADFERFAGLTRGHQRLDADGIAAIEPALERRFRHGLFYKDEGHLDPRRVLPALHARLRESGGVIRTASGGEPAGGRITIDCRGLSARDAIKELRGVKGEVVIIETGEVSLSRPLRLLHPRWPLYVIPRVNHRFFLGATSIESEDTGVSVRSVLELLTAAYAVHPAFAEARIIEIGAGLRPALPDNMPQVGVDGTTISVNGLYRHGFLLAPALAELTVNYVRDGLVDNEVMRCA
jgi:glycine oxidase